MAQLSENCSTTSVFACGKSQRWGLDGWGLRCFNYSDSFSAPFWTFRIFEGPRGPGSCCRFFFSHVGPEGLVADKSACRMVSLWNSQPNLFEANLNFLCKRFIILRLFSKTLNNTLQNEHKARLVLALQGLWNGLTRFWRFLGLETGNGFSRISFPQVP